MARNFTLPADIPSVEYEAHVALSDRANTRQLACFIVRIDLAHVAITALAQWVPVGLSFLAAFSSLLSQIRGFPDVVYKPSSLLDLSSGWRGVPKSVDGPEPFATWREAVTKNLEAGGRGGGFISSMMDRLRARRTPGSQRALIGWGEAPVPGFTDVVLFFQFVAATGQFNIDYPLFYQDLVRNFAWAIPTFNFGWFGALVDVFRGGSESQLTLRDETDTLSNRTGIVNLRRRQEVPESPTTTTGATSTVGDILLPIPSGTSTPTATVSATSTPRASPLPAFTPPSESSPTGQLLAGFERFSLLLGIHPRNIFLHTLFSTIFVMLLVGFVCGWFGFVAIALEGMRRRKKWMEKAYDWNTVGVQEPPQPLFRYVLTVAYWITGNLLRVWMLCLFGLTSTALYQISIAAGGTAINEIQIDPVRNTSSNIKNEPLGVSIVAALVLLGVCIGYPGLLVLRILIFGFWKRNHDEEGNPTAMDELVIEDGAAKLYGDENDIFSAYSQNPRDTVTPYRPSHDDGDDRSFHTVQEDFHSPSQTSQRRQTNPLSPITASTLQRPRTSSDASPKSNTPHRHPLFASRTFMLTYGFLYNIFSPKILSANPITAGFLLSLRLYSLIAPGVAVGLAGWITYRITGERNVGSGGVFPALIQMIVFGSGDFVWLLLVWFGGKRMEKGGNRNVFASRERLRLMKGLVVVRILVLGSLGTGVVFGWI
ncbi:hypothetical protein HK102_002406, partial [Quaeritorhiza haematococci]